MPVVAAALLAATAAVGSYEQYQVDNETTCVGPADKAFAEPESWLASGYRYTVRGASAEVRPEAAAGAPEAKAAGDGKPAAAATGTVKLGLLSAVKDFSKDTQANLAQFIAAFKKAGVSGIVVDGDSAYGVDAQDSTLSELFVWLGGEGGQGLPVYAVIGNSESRSAFNRALLDAFRKSRNVINLDLVRSVDLGGLTLLSLPGYYDKRFIHESAGCLYSPDDIQELTRLSRNAPSPVVLITHGPPRQSGKGALDFTVDGNNVGDKELARFLGMVKKIPFGVFGHILEAGGRATDLEGTHAIRQNTPSATLFVNPGPAFADPWALNDGRTSHGMAAIFTVKNGKGEWQQVVAAPVKAAKGRAPSRLR